jgi:hypothetical protein
MNGGKKKKKKKKKRQPEFHPDLGRDEKIDSTKTMSFWRWVLLIHRPL